MRLLKEAIKKLNDRNNKNIKADIIESLQNAIETLKKRKNRIFRILYRRVYRLKKAFPDIQSNEITEILGRKIELIKKDIHKTKEEKWYKRFI